jgi:hypothetical protein
MECVEKSASSSQKPSQFTVFKEASMDQQKQLEQLILVSIDAAKAMLDEYGLVLPFGARAFNNSEDIKMHCPGADDMQADWNDQINMVIDELKKYIASEDIFATALVTSLESEDGSGIGLQVETNNSSALFVYPYNKKDGEWVIEEPVETDQLLASVYS